MTDAISKETVLKMISRTKEAANADEAGFTKSQRKAIRAIADLFLSVVKDIPAIDAVPVVHARWIGGKYYNDVYGYEKTCTACKKEYVVGFDYQYCPYCGAKCATE